MAMNQYQEIFSLKYKSCSDRFPDDIPALQKIMQKVIKGVPYAEAELRIAGAEGKYIWCRIRMTTQFDDSGKGSQSGGGYTGYRF